MAKHPPTNVNITTQNRIVQEISKGRYLITTVIAARRLDEVQSPPDRRRRGTGQETRVSRKASENTWLFDDLLVVRPGLHRTMFFVIPHRRSATVVPPDPGVGSNAAAIRAAARATRLPRVEVPADGALHTGSDVDARLASHRLARGTCLIPQYSRLKVAPLWNGCTV